MAAEGPTIRFDNDDPRDAQILNLTTRLHNLEQEVEMFHEAMQEKPARQPMSEDTKIKIGMSLTFLGLGGGLGLSTWSNTPWPIMIGVLIAFMAIIWTAD